jgi:hypothetical protein
VLTLNIRPPSDFPKKPFAPNQASRSQPSGLTGAGKYFAERQSLPRFGFSRIFTLHFARTKKPPLDATTALNQPNQPSDLNQNRSPTIITTAFSP